MESIDILILAVAIATLAPFILVTLMMIGVVVLFVLTMIGGILITVWEFICKSFKGVK